MDAWILISLCPSYNPVVSTPFMESSFVLLCWFEGHLYHILHSKKFWSVFLLFLIAVIYQMPTFLLDCKLCEYEHCVFSFACILQSLEYVWHILAAGAQYSFSCIWECLWSSRRMLPLFPQIGLKMTCF